MSDKCEGCAALSAKLSLLENHAAAVSAELLDERARNMKASGIENQRTADAEQRIRELEAKLASGISFSPMRNILDEQS